MITTEERGLVRDNIILLKMLEMIDLNRNQIENSTNLLRPIFLKAADRLIDLILADLKNIRMQLRKANIKWWEAEQKDLILNYHIVCRGFEDTFGMTRDVAKTQLSIKFGEYFALVSEPFKARSIVDVESVASNTV
ncbi:hypothetical protein I8J29_16585 [Paenibacillus sp. MWE-103]|uniref:Uncharacterized protein n=1 Tax=Paenibacillus artemisiicola TaxID=1172618 RepID=A0ABS3WC07_9BACL|nr:hypothetical protein [Paenibacillus artemisiicola]MBO7745827.1 hypothetical protein [Paenibacillus artemisiicola]